MNKVCIPVLRLTSLHQSQGTHSATSSPPLTIGVELELNFPPLHGQPLRIEELQKSLEMAGIPCQYYERVTHEVTPHWKLLRDQSIKSSGQETPMEIVSPILTPGELGKLRDLMKALMKFHPLVRLYL